MTKPDPPLELIDFRNKQMRVIRELGLNEGAEYRRAVVQLRDFQTARMLLPMITAELADFREAIGRANMALAGTTEKQLDDLAERFNLDSNRHLLSYLSAVRTYLDHTETRLKRQYGPSGPFANFKRARSEAYDGSFAYRFLDQLRNYGQHCGLPIGHIALSAIAQTPGGPVHLQATFGFDPHALLAQGGDKTWKGKVRSELTGMTGVLAIDPILEEATTRLSEIEAATLAAERPYLFNVAKPITDVFAEIPQPGGVPAVVVIRPAGPSGSEVDFIRPSNQALGWLGFNYIGLQF